MTDIAPTDHHQHVTISFHGDEIVTCIHEGQPYVALKHVCGNLGLSWGSQHTKLANAVGKFMCTDIGTVGTDGRHREMLGIPVTRLALWLATINPNNIPDPIRREKIELYQAESAIALHDYWTKALPSTQIGCRRTSNLSMIWPLRCASLGRATRRFTGS